MKILIIEDEKINRIALSNALKKSGHEVVSCKDGIEGLHAFKENDFDLVISDLKLPGADGITVLKKVKEIKKDAEVIIITGYATIETAITALKNGAYDYITKPYPLEEILNKVTQVENMIKVRKENIELKKQLKKEYEFIGVSKKSKQLIETIKIIANRDTSILIEGESGTGKEVVARLIHNLSNRKNHPFVAVNCAAIPQNLLESELFGYERGAFSGAESRKVGFLEKANNGTFFIDDIDDFPLNLQVKLLRVIQEKEIVRLGGNTTVTLNIRFIFATKKPLKQLVSKGEFREDLYYRLSVIPIKLPPLRERKEDIPVLIEHFLKKHGGDDRAKEILQKNLDKLSEYNWPGNVRELENLVQRVIAIKHFPEDFNSNLYIKEKENFNLTLYLEEIEKRIIKSTLNECNYSISMAAKRLNIPRTTLSSKIKKYSIKKPD